MQTTNPAFGKLVSTVAALAATLAFVQASGAQTFTTLATFDGANGINPLFVSLVQGTNGAFYGTTLYATGGYGTVFSVTAAGALKTIHTFELTDGGSPNAGLIQAADGYLYGTTSLYGAYGYGTIFRISPTGSLTTLQSFDLANGANAYAALVQGPNGSLYGTTSDGGTGGCSCGTIFQLTPGGTLTTLHSFDRTDGGNPYAGLLQAADGNFYGATITNGSLGWGTIFKITPGGTLTTLHSFNLADGAGPTGGLVQASDGNLYGATAAGGTGTNCGPYGCGTVFKITPGGSLTTMHSFNMTDGSSPQAGLVQATDGNFYGTTVNGGPGNQGTIFRITTGGVLTTLHTFNSKDGVLPYGGLLQATDGKFYGTTFTGGPKNYGSVFSLSVGLGPFVKPLPSSGVAGTVIRILGTALTGATSVTFNGTAAAFTVVAASEITATVPGGATTGKIQVVTPGGTLLSNVPFRVQP